MEKWFKYTLPATAAMNIGGAILIVPPFSFGRELFGLPITVFDG